MNGFRLKLCFRICSLAFDISLRLWNIRNINSWTSESIHRELSTTTVAMLCYTREQLMSFRSTDFIIPRRTRKTLFMNRLWRPRRYRAGTRESTCESFISRTADDPISAAATNANKNKLPSGRWFSAALFNAVYSQQICLDSEHHFRT